MPYQTFEQRHGVTLESARKIREHYRAEGVRIFVLYGGIRPLAKSLLSNWLDTIPEIRHARIREAFWSGWNAAESAKVKA